jgi:conjugative relaxase-like TrwC/TraI family protein
MLFINHATDTKAAKDYLTQHLSRSDYYTRDAQELAGQWHGHGAELLGLSGKVDRKNYFRLCENRDPRTGESLTPRTRAQRRVLYDFTFDAPKSVTLAYQLGGDERIADAFDEAVAETMGEMEDAMQVRVRQNGGRDSRASGNLVWAEFKHQTTRPVTDKNGVSAPDPHLHTHAVAFNCSFDPVEERWKAGEFEHLVRDRGYYQAAFHSCLSEKLARFGYGIERDGKSFKLAGIDRTTCEEFSRRTRIIDAEARKLGLTDAKALRELGRRTREAKPETPMSMSELREMWNKRIREEDRKAILGARAGQQTAALDADGAVDYAISHCFEHASTVTETKFLETALAQSYGKASVVDVRRSAVRDGVLRKERNGQRYVTTRDVLKEEIDMTNYVRNGKATRRRLGGDEPIELDTNLSDEQRQAALILLNSKDKVMGLRGRAGTGKTTMMWATVGAIEKTGKKVFAFAPSAEASRGVLRAEGFTNAETVERLLIDPEMQRQINGQVLLIDEAGLLSVKDMKRLFDVAEAQNARVILAGDTGQHNAVARGDGLRILEKNAGLQCATLEQIRRQTNNEYRQAVAAIADGDAMGKGGRTRLEEGLEAFDRMGAIIETPGEERYRQIAEDYADIVSQRKKNGELKTSLVIAPTHAEIRHVTGAIRDMLKARGQLSGNEMEYTALHPCNLTEAERTDFANYVSGEIVQFHQNAKGFKRGERVSVKSAGIAGVGIARADGSEAILPFGEAKKFQVYRPEKLMLAEKDKVRFTMNGFTRETRRGGKLARSRVNNGSIGEVKRLLKNGDIELTNGFIIPKDYGGLDYGYVVTSHASQGKTVDVPLVALGSESFAAVNREQLYVSLSRGREAVRLYTDDKAAMMEAVQGSTARLSATELMEEEEQTPERKAAARDRLYRHVRRAFHRRRERNAARDFIAAYEHNQQRKGPGHER